MKKKIFETISRDGEGRQRYDQTAGTLADADA